MGETVDEIMPCLISCGEVLSGGQQKEGCAIVCFVCCSLLK